MTPQQFSIWLKNASIIASNALNRMIIVIEGSEQWIDSMLQTIPSYPVNTLEQTQDNSWLIYNDSNEVSCNVNKHTFKNKLGTESDFVLFYSHSFNIDALAALSGTIRPGGALIIAIPSVDTFTVSSKFNKRVIEKLNANSDINYFIESVNNQTSLVEAVKLKRVPVKSPLQFGCKTQDQLIAVEHIIHVVNGHRNRPLVLTADRGRGKSSALAIACANVLANTSSFINIVITSAHRKSLDIFFAQLNKCLNNEVVLPLNTYVIEHKNGSVQFIAMDDLLINKPDTGLLLIDEAASVPLYQLNELMLHYHRTVFSSTVHGYEGAGRSFSLKFQQGLKETYPNAKHLHIYEPIRWNDNDPLEAFIFDLCLLNAELPIFSVDCENIQQDTITFERVSAKALAANELLLSNVFAVLVTAHYQTSPSDLRLLLDNNKLDIIVMLINQHIVGVALLVIEGNLNCHEVDLVKTNIRRLKNQFIPQSLLTHCGEESSFDYSYYRIMRIAILPELQNRGLGQQFLSHIESFAKGKNVDFVGTSFGATNQLLNFWLKQQYKIARLGFTKDKASGEYSALLLKPLNKTAKSFLHTIETNFYTSFDYLLSEQFTHLSATLVWQIMHYCPVELLPELTGRDKKAIEDFYTARRQYSHCVLSLHKWLQHQMLHSFDASMLPIINKVFQKRGIEEVCVKYKYTGKKSFNQYLQLFVCDYVNLSKNR